MQRNTPAPKAHRPRYFIREDRPANPHTIEFRDGDGNRRFRGFPTEERALAFVKEVTAASTLGLVDDLVQDVQAARENRVRRRTFADAANALLAEKGTRNRQFIDTQLRLRILPTFGHRRLDRIKSDECQEWMNKLTKAGVSEPTRTAALRVLRQVFNWAITHEWVDVNPARKVTMPKKDRRPKLPMDADQVMLLARILDETWPRHKLGAAVMVAGFGGLRSDEVRRMRVGDLTPSTGELMVRGAKGQGDTDTEKVRFIFIPDEVVERLLPHLQGKRSQDRILTGQGNGPLNMKWFYKHRYRPTVEALCDEGLLPITTWKGKTVMPTFHDLRHSCVRMLMDEGAEMYDIQKYLGHARIQITIDTYGSWTKHASERPRHLLSGAIKKAS